MGVKTVLVIGSGTMGQMIAQLCLEQGKKVHLYDVDDQYLQIARRNINKMLRKKVVAGNLTAEQEEGLHANISYFTEPFDAAQNVDLISESVPEDPELKGQVFQIFHELCEPETLFTTNTSSLRPSQFAEATGRPDRFCALHFHDTRVTKVVDVMPHEKTSAETIRQVTEFTREIGQIPIVLEKENNGYVFNNMLMSLLNSALALAQKKVTSIEEIDKSWMGVMHTAIGPFGIMDSVGLETVWKITNYWAEKRNDKQSKANANFIKSYLDRGKRGAKTGEGFYSYPDPKFMQADFLS